MDQMNPAFNPNQAPVFSQAYGKLLYENFSVKLFRFILTLSFLILIMGLVLDLDFTNNVITLKIVGVLTLFMMVEIYYHYHINSFVTQTAIQSDPDNKAKVISLEAATEILKAGQKPLTLLTNLLKKRGAGFILLRAGLAPKEILQLVVSSQKTGSENFTLEQIITQAEIKAKLLHHQQINNNDLLLAYFETFTALKEKIFNQGVKDSDLANIAYWQERQSQDLQVPLFSFTPTQGFAAGWAAGYTLTLETFTRNLSKEILQTHFASAFIGRDPEIAYLETVLSRTNKRNVLLVGDPGVGKSAIIRGLIMRAQEGQSNSLISFKRFLELNVTALLAGVQNQGDLEERLKIILEEMGNSDVILVIPQLQNLTGSSGSGNFDISGILEPYLKNSSLQILATANQTEYRRDIEPKKGFLENFEVSKINEPTPEEIIRICESIAPLFEHRYQMLITYKALLKTIDLSDKVEPDRLYPGKAISILDEVMAFSNRLGKNVLTEEDVTQFLETKTKIPLRTADPKESKKLLNLETDLKKRVIGQEFALKALAMAIERSRTLVKDPDRPIGVFLFLGPTGVGKTETAKSLAQIYFGAEDEMIRFDMSEYQEQVAVEKLIGTPNEPESGQLTTKIHENPYSLLLLDELEKAHPKVLDLFLQVFDEGHLTDGAGRKVRFNNTIIIATANAGSELIREKVTENTDLTNLKPILLDYLQRQNIFRPEFLNRFDDVIIYQPLTSDQIEKVAGLQLQYLVNRLKKEEINLTISQPALKKLAGLGYDPTYGARALKRALQEQIENPIAVLLLNKTLPKGTVIKVDLDPGGTFSINT